MTEEEQQKSFLILTIINQQGSKGTTTKDLSKKTGIDRWTIGDICRKLEEKERIEKRKKGKSNAYFPTQKIIDYNSFIESYLLKKKIHSNYFSANFILDKDKLHENNAYREKYLLNPTFNISDSQVASILGITDNDQIKKYENFESISLNKLPLYLQNFILNVGIFVTFVFLKSSSPDLTKTISKEIGKNSEDLVNRKILEWLSAIISPKDLYHDFRHLFLRCGIRDFEHKKSIENKKEIKTFDLSKPLFLMLEDILNHLYPDHTNKLNHIYLNLKKDYEGEKRFAYQNLCEHKYTVDKNTDSESLLFNCQHCKKKLRYKQSDIWYPNEIREELKFIPSQRKNKKKFEPLESEIQDIHGNCKCFDGEHFLFIKTQFNDLLNGEQVEKTFQCLFCNNKWSFIIDKKIMEKVSEEIESIVGVDVISKSLSNSIFAFIIYNKNLSINPDEVTLKGLTFYGLYYKYQKSIKEFDKDKRNILKILLKYKFINHIYAKNPLILSHFIAFPIYQTYQWSTDIISFEIKI